MEYSSTNNYFSFLPHFHTHQSQSTVILKDVAYEVMNALLQFMYQGVVHVKHDELKNFMQIAASLQIKGLTAHGEYHHHHNAAAHNATPVNTPTQQQQNLHSKYNNNNTDSEVLTPSRDTASSMPSLNTTTMSTMTSKRSQDVHHEPYPIMPKRPRNHHPQQQHQPHRFMAELLHQVHSQQQNQRTSGECDLSSNSDEGSGMMNPTGSSVSEEALMPAISLTESPAFQLGHVKRELVEGHGASPSGHNTINNNNICTANANNNNKNGSERALFLQQPLKIEFGGADLQAFKMANRTSMGLSNPSSPASYKYDHHTSEHLNMSNDLSFSKSANHMDIPTGEWGTFYSLLLLVFCSFWYPLGLIISMSGLTLNWFTFISFTVILLLVLIWELIVMPLVI